MIKAIHLKCADDHSVMICLYDPAPDLPDKLILVMLAAACATGAFSDTCPECGKLAQDVAYADTSAATWLEVPVKLPEDPKTLPPNTAFILTRKDGKTQFCRLSLRHLGDIVNPSRN